MVSSEWVIVSLRRIVFPRVEVWMKILYWIMVPFIIIAGIVYMVIFGIAFMIADRIKYG